MGFTRVYTQTMPGAPDIVQKWDQFFWMNERDHTWRYSGWPLHVIPWASSALYIVLVYLLPPLLMRNTNLRRSISKGVKPFMMFWNLFLSVISAFMFVGITGPFIYLLRDEGLWRVICNPDETVVPPVGSHVFWAALFSYSKFFELIDTLFLILKNPERPVPFLHWYHHFSVLIFTWYAANWKLSIGMMFAIVNSIVHAFMYWYYFQKERGYDPIWAKPLTIAQILQMVLGLGLNLTWLYGYMSGYGCACENPTTLIAMGSTIYASYLFLFMKYFLERYVFNSGKKPAPAKPKTTKKDETKKEK